MIQRQRNQRSVSPVYPTRPELLASPGQLWECLPPAWQSIIAKGGLSAAFLVSGLPGCTKNESSRTAPPNAGVAANATTQPMPKAAQLTVEAAIVAPIFEHGEGRAVTGCMVMSPPVFLTEEEARQIITEELAKAGLKMSAKHVELKDVRIKPKSRFGFVTTDGKREIVEYGDEPRPLKVDLMDPDKHIAVEFVSEENYLELGGELSPSTVQEYDFKKVRGTVADQIKSSGKGNFFGVFYEPSGSVPSPDFSTVEREGKTKEQQNEIRNRKWKEAEEEGKKRSREELRKQVADFAEWLRQRGVI